MHLHCGSTSNPTSTAPCMQELDAKGPLNAMAGDFLVPSYRGASFMDPKVSIYRFPIQMHARKSYVCAPAQASPICLTGALTWPSAWG